MIDIVRSYEAECAHCGKLFTAGAVNRSNEDFIKMLKNAKWIVGDTRNDTFCSKRCKRLNT